MAQQALPNFFLGNITKGNSFEVLPLNWCVYQHQHQLLVKYQESVIATSSLFFWCFFTIYKTLCNKSEEYYLLNHCKGLKKPCNKFRSNDLFFSSKFTKYVHII